MNEPKFIELGGALRDCLEARAAAAADKEFDALMNACDEDTTRKTRYDHLAVHEVRALRRFYLAVAWSDGEVDSAVKLFVKLDERLRRKVPKVIVKWLETEMER